MRTSVRNWPHSCGSTSSAKIAAPSPSCSPVGVSGPCHRPARGVLVVGGQRRGREVRRGQQAPRHEFHAHVRWREAVQLRGNAHPQPLTARQIAGRVREQSQAHPRPGRAHALLPLGKRTRAGEATGRQPPLLRGRRLVQTLRVVEQHAAHVEGGNDGHHGALAARAPTAAGGRSRRGRSKAAPPPPRARRESAPPRARRAARDPARWPAGCPSRCPASSLPPTSHREC